MKHVLNEEHRWTLINALATAKSRYLELGKADGIDVNPGIQRLRDQFVRQASQVEEMMYLIEQADEIRFD